ncbi:hypothetical protein Q9L58_007298 [Maublancomyces gigas]|uniref:Uncharacterized protein n=1 Tax=Discina gigas TaxID=1032678 RepID=A0ABR3GD15_9PEZI
MTLNVTAVAPIAAEGTEDPGSLLAQGRVKLVETGIGVKFKRVIALIRNSLEHDQSVLHPPLEERFLQAARLSTATACGG